MCVNFGILILALDGWDFEGVFEPGSHFSVESTVAMSLPPGSQKIHGAGHCFTSIRAADPQLWSRQPHTLAGLIQDLGLQGLA